MYAPFLNFAESTCLDCTERLNLLRRYLLIPSLIPQARPKLPGARPLTHNGAIPPPFRPTSLEPRTVVIFRITFPQRAAWSAAVMEYEMTWKRTSAWSKTCSSPGLPLMSPTFLQNPVKHPRHLRPFSLRSTHSMEVCVKGTMHPPTPCLPSLDARPSSLRLPYRLHCNFVKTRDQLQVVLPHSVI